MDSYPMRMADWLALAFVAGCLVWAFFLERREQRMRARWAHVDQCFACRAALGPDMFKPGPCVLDMLEHASQTRDCRDKYMAQTGGHPTDCPACIDRYDV